MNKKIINKSLEKIASDIGINKAEVSMALNAKRLLGREKLKKVVDAGYSLELFVFGKSYLQDNDTSINSKTSRVQK